MKLLVRACNTSYAYSLRLAFRLLTCVLNKRAVPSSATRTFHSSCNARSSSMTINPHLCQMTTCCILLGCLVAVVGYCTTWSPFSSNICHLPLAKLDCPMRVLMMTPFHGCGLAIVRATPRVGARFPDRILGGYTV